MNKYLLTEVTPFALLRDDKVEETITKKVSFRNTTDGWKFGLK